MYNGYSVFGRLGGTLVPGEFKRNELTYTVLFLLHNGTGLYLGLNQIPYNDFILQVGDTSYRGSESSKRAAQASPTYFWHSATSGWIVGEPTEISMTFLEGSLSDEREPAPLTAYFRNAPERHDGQTDFTLRLYFNEATPVTVHDLSEALIINGGRLVEVMAVDSEGRIWSLTMSPNSNSVVNVILPVETDCEVQGAICSHDGRMLSN